MLPKDAPRSAYPKRMTDNGYATPVTSVNSNNITDATRNCVHMIILLRQAGKYQQQIDEFNTKEWDDQSTHSIYQQVVTQ